MESIILLHGALGAAQSMQPLARILEINAEVHVLEFSGHGKTEWPEGAFTIDTFEQDVMRLMDERNIEAAHLFGYSMGGFVALRLAARVPERIKSVITLATKLDWTEETCAKEAGGLNADAIEAKVPKFAEGLNTLHIRNGWKKIVNESSQLLKSMSGYRFATEDYSNIRTPVRLLLGDRDKMVSMEETLAAYRALPNAELGIMPKTPHPFESVNLLLLTDMILSKVYE